MLGLKRTTLALLALGLAAGGGAGASVVGSAAAGEYGSATCIGHHPQPFIWYTSGCTGHDEPEIDPLSNRPGSAQNLTWTIVLPTDGRAQVDQVGPTFWMGGTVHDPLSLFNQAFLELQFYPNSITSDCTRGGGYIISYRMNAYTACSPVWAVTKNGKNEYAAFNAMLTDSRTGGPLVMHAGDTITDHQYITPNHDGMHITVTDVTTGHSGTIVLDGAKSGPLMPEFSVQKIGNSLGWGLVHDAPNALVWEIGHTGNFTHPAGNFCLPGSTTRPACYSYNIPTWKRFSPLVIKSVTFGGAPSQGWGVVSDYGGRAEINHYCGRSNYGKPFCWYPWYAYNGAHHGFTFGGDYPGTTDDFGRVTQYQQRLQCMSPAGPFKQYCMTILH